MLKHDVTTENKPDVSDVPPGEDDSAKVMSTDEETKAIRERIISIRRKIHKSTVAAVTARWNFEEGVCHLMFDVFFILFYLGLNTSILKVAVLRLLLFF